ncbi:hypothetical protein AAFO90_22650 [Phaeobacter sp. CAU 1743]
MTFVEQAQCFGRRQGSDRASGIHAESRKRASPGSSRAGRTVRDPLLGMPGNIAGD